MKLDYDDLAIDVTPSRRLLLKWSAAGTVLLFGNALPNFGISTALAADLGSGDVGVLN